MSSNSEKWPLMFLKEAEKLKTIFRNEMRNSYHIGSTSVPDLKAKPIIDFIPVVRNINIVDTCNQDMMEIGYHPSRYNRNYRFHPGYYRA